MLISPFTLVGVPSVTPVILAPLAQTSNSAPTSVTVFSLMPTPFGSLNTTRNLPEVPVGENVLKVTVLPASGEARLAVGNSTGFGAGVPGVEAAPASVVTPGNSEKVSTLKPESRNPVTGEIEKAA